MNRVSFHVDFPTAEAGPIADTEDLASFGRRVMFTRNVRTGAFEFFIAPAGEVTSGWVVAVEKK